MSADMSYAKEVRVLLMSSCEAHGISYLPIRSHLPPAPLPPRPNGVPRSSRRPLLGRFSVWVASDD